MLIPKKVISDKDKVMCKKDKVIHDMKRDIQSLPDKMHNIVGYPSHYNYNQVQYHQQCKNQCKISLRKIINRKLLYLLCDELTSNTVASFDTTEKKIAHHKVGVNCVKN